MVTGYGLGHIKAPEYFRTGRNIIRTCTSLNIFSLPRVIELLFEQQITNNIFVCRSRNLFCNKEPAWVLFRHITEPEYSACTWPYVLNHACESFMVSRSRVFHSWCNVTVLEYFTFCDAYFYIINYINPTRSHPLVLCMWSVFDTSETVFFIKACIQSECMTHTNIYELFTIFFTGAWVFSHEYVRFLCICIHISTRIYNNSTL